MKKVDLSVVIPVYNEKAGLPEVLKRLHEVLRKRFYEIIVVDDGSEDGSAETVAARGQNVRMLRHPYNKGYGAALKTGIRQARGEWVLIIDADGSYPVEVIPQLLKEAGRYDMVVGARTKLQPSGLLIRRFAKFFLKKLANFLVGRDIPDLNSGLRVFRKREALGLFGILPSGFSFTTTITLGYLSHEQTVGYVPIDYAVRVGSSKIRPLHDSFNFLMLIARTMMYFNPLKIFLLLSLVLLTGGLGEAAYFLVVYHSLSKSTVLVLLAAFMVATLGLLADLIVKRISLLEGKGGDRS